MSPRRIVDLAVAGAALVVLAPVLAALALAVRLTSPGPAFFRQVRVGRGGRPFVLLKLRTMTRDAEQRRTQLLTESKDPGWLHLDHDPRAEQGGNARRAIGAVVVNDDHFVHERRHALEHIADAFLLVVARDYNAHRQATISHTDSLSPYHGTPRAVCHSIARSASHLKLRPATAGRCGLRYWALHAPVPARRRGAHRRGAG